MEGQRLLLEPGAGNKIKYKVVNRYGWKRGKLGELYLNDLTLFSGSELS